MARRRNSISKRFAKMKGLDPSEKALMQRVAHLMDAALNNRQSSNPFEESTNRVNRQVYPPTGLLAQQGISSIKLIWDAANSNEHLRYEIEFVNMDTGTRTIKTSYTNYVIFKGENGSYIAKVSSVGRDGSKSTVKQVEFGIGNDVMLIEGAKNAAVELGTLIQDNIKIYKDFSIYVWGHVVLDKQVLDTNNPVVFRLWRAEYPDAVFADAVLQQTITLYPATESGNSLDTTARAGLISRPVAARPGTFESTQSLMFSPMEVDDADDEKTVTYFLEAINRAEENDEVNLSITMWAGQDGVGSAVPGDTWVPPSPYVFPHLNSFHQQAPGWQQAFPYDKRDACAYIPDGYSMIGNEWTIAMWIRFDDLDAVKMATAPDEGSNPNGGSRVIFSRNSSRADRADTLNQWRFTVGAQFDGQGGMQHSISASVGWYNVVIGRASSVAWTTVGTTFGDRNELSPILPWGDAIGSSNDDHDLTNNGWYFFVFCWSGGNFVGGVPKLRVYLNFLVDFWGRPQMGLLAPAGVDGTLVNPCVQTDEQALSYQFGLEGDALTVGKVYEGEYTGDLNQMSVTNKAYHMLGIWNTALDSTQAGKGWNIGPISALYNDGISGEFDWKQPIERVDPGSFFAYLNYNQQENLIHQIQFGAVEREFRSLETLRDTGFFLPGGDLNFTANSAADGHFDTWHQTTDAGGHFHQRHIDTIWYDGLGQSWSRGTDIYDILSPEGNNNTTQYNYAYPGQNMEPPI